METTAESSGVAGRKRQLNTSSRKRKACDDPVSRDLAQIAPGRSSAKKRALKTKEQKNPQEKKDWPVYFHDVSYLTMQVPSPDDASRPSYSRCIVTCMNFWHIHHFFMHDCLDI